MADVLTPDQRSRCMSSIRSKGSQAELIVRRIAYGLGARYRLHDRKLPGNPDLVFRGRRRVIFVHGCFWHQHNCRDGRVPTSNIEYWVPKLVKNQVRDSAAVSDLLSQGW